MEMQKSLGELSAQVKALTEQSKNNSEKIDKISHHIYAAKCIWNDGAGCHVNIRDGEAKVPHRVSHSGMKEA